MSSAGKPAQSVRPQNDAPERPKKSLGQHFLKDPAFTRKIVQTAEIEPYDLVVEVGPGRGILTEELARALDPARGGKLVAIELDQHLIPGLEERFAGRKHVSFVHGDVLEVAPSDLTGGLSYKLVANIPYYITSAILRHFLEASKKPQTLTVMVQHEVAERMTARPPEMSLLALAVQFYGEPKVVFRVPPGAFVPPPKVESAVVHMRVFPDGASPYHPTSEAHFFKVAQAGFGQRRKQLANTLAAGLDLPKTKVAPALAAAGIDPSRRAETLTMQEWISAERALSAIEEIGGA